MPCKSEAKLPSNLSLRTSNRSQFLTRQQAATELSMTTQYVDGLLARGLLNTYRFGRSVRLRRDEFDKWIADRRERTQ